MRRIRDQDPARFAGLPPGVQRHADARADREWKVAGLCGVHSGRPEVCRGFPYQRLPAPDGAVTPVDSSSFLLGSRADTRSEPTGVSDTSILRSVER